MPNSSLPNLTTKSVPALTDLTYIAKDDLAGWFTDSKCSVTTLKSFCVTSPTVVKTVDYSIPSSECDGRWFSNKGASSSIKFILPVSEEEIEVSFVLEANNIWTEISPRGNDFIAPISTVDGQSVYGLNFGSTIRLRGIRGGWQVFSSYGTWNTEGSSSSSSSLSLSSCSSSSYSSSCSSSCSSWCSSSCSSSSCCSSWCSSSCSSSLSSSISSSMSTSFSSMSSSSQSSSSSSQDFTDTVWMDGYDNGIIWDDLS